MADNRAYLAAVSTGRRYPLNGAEAILGRHPDCDVQIEVGSVSRHHARIIEEAGQYFLEDLKSRNFTYLNDAKVEGRQLLHHGDMLRICDTDFKFCRSTGDDVVVVDDEATISSTIMSKLDVSSSRSGVRLTSSPETKLKALLDITRMLGKTLALNEVLPTVLDSLFKVFVQADRGFIGLVNADGEIVHRWQKARQAHAEDAMRVSRTILRQVMETKEAILSADAAGDQRFDMSQSISEFRIRSMMCVPLVDTEEKVLGVIQVDTLDQRKQFKHEDLELLVSVASQAGIAIDNAQMHERALKQQAVERDLELAHEVQQSLLPIRHPELPGYEFYDFYRPAHFVGGDYFDYITLPDGRLAVIVADVVGHGVAAALLMAKLSAEARYCLASNVEPAVAVNTLNNRLSQLQIERFVTMIMTVLDPRTHRVTIVNAGHMAPIHLRADGSIAEPGQESSGLPLGIVEDIEYRQVELQLAAGECLTMYTDGIPECENSGQYYSIERVRERILKGGSASPSTLGPAIIQDVEQFLGQGVQDDDMCLVAYARQ